MSEPVALELREQFATPDQQRETSSIGMWIFLMTEVMLFGGLFMAYTVYRLMNPQAFDVGSAHMESMLGAINTGVLICSSFTMALAVHAARENEKGPTACLKSQSLRAMTPRWNAVKACQSI